MSTRYPLTQQQPVKPPPAPGASPVGGTTSLPQHLQPPAPTTRPVTEQRTPAPATGGGAASPYPGVNNGSPQLAPVPTTPPPGTVPPPPPAPAPAPVATQPAPGGTEPVLKDEAAGNQTKMGDELFKQLMDLLTRQGSTWDGTKEAEGLRSQGYAKLDDERRLAEDRAKADAAARGVFNGSPLTNSLGDIGERYLRGGADLETNIQRDMGQRGEAWQQQELENKRRAIEMIFGYGDRQQQQGQFDDELWIRLMELGLVGGPQMPQPGNI